MLLGSTTENFKLLRNIQAYAEPLWRASGLARRIGSTTGRLLHIPSVQKNTGLFYKDLQRLVQNPGTWFPENVSHAGGLVLRHCKTIAVLFSVSGQPLHHSNKGSPI